MGSSVLIFMLQLSKLVLCNSVSTDICQLLLMLKLISAFLVFFFLKNPFLCAAVHIRKWLPLREPRCSFTTIALVATLVLQQWGVYFAQLNLIHVVAKFFPSRLNRMWTASNWALFMITEVVRWKIGWQVDLPTIRLRANLFRIEHVLEVLVRTEWAVCHHILRACVRLVFNLVFAAVVLGNWRHLLLWRRFFTSN